jgi:hypothetical protein
MIVVVVTFALFTLALFVKGFTHDLFLEAGVFLISVKLILMAYRNSLQTKIIEKRLDEIKHLLNKSNDTSAN